MKADLQKYYHALLNGVVTIKVQFKVGQREYTYRALKSAGIVVGDEVVIEYAGRFHIAKVTQVHTTAVYDDEEGITYKWIVSKVEKEQYLQQVAQEEAFERQFEDMNASAKQQAMVEELVNKFGSANVQALSAVLNSPVQESAQVDAVKEVVARMMRNAAEVGTAKAAGNIAKSVDGAANAIVLRVGRIQRPDSLAYSSLRSEYEMLLRSMDTVENVTKHTFMTIDTTMFDAEAKFDAYKRQKFPFEQFLINKGVKA